MGGGAARPVRHPGAIAIIGLVGQAESPATGTAALPNGTDSREAAELRDQLPEAEGSAAVVLYSSDQPLTAEELALVQERARTLPGATGMPPVVSEDGTAATVVVPVNTKDAVETADVVTELRADAKADLPEGLTAQVTGPAAIQADLAAVFDGANFRLLAATASVVAILLVITYRSPSSGWCRSPSSASPTSWPPCWPPTPSPPSACSGTSRRSASSRCSSSVPAPTTRCC